MRQVQPERLLEQAPPCPKCGHEELIFSKCPYHGGCLYSVTCTNCSYSTALSYNQQRAVEEWTEQYNASKKP